MRDHPGKRLARKVESGELLFVAATGLRQIASYVSSLEARLEKAREVIEPVAESGKALAVYSKALDEDDHLQVRTSVASLRAARAWMEQNDASALKSQS